MIFSVNQYVHHCRVELFELPFIEVGIKRPIEMGGQLRSNRHQPNGLWCHRGCGCGGRLYTVLATLIGDRLIKNEPQILKIFHLFHSSL